MRRLILFAKRPRLGRVKTRLVPPLTPEQALELYRAFLADQLRFLESMRPRYAIELCLDGPDRSIAPEGIVVTEQGPGDLGRRMLAAMVRSHDSGARATVIIGADAPTLPANHVHTAFERLDATDPAVISPAEDGGYVLIGLREPRPHLFHEIAWGGSSVCAATRRRAAEAGLSLFELPVWYDVDDAESLERLRAQLQAVTARQRAPETSRVVERLRR